MSELPSFIENTRNGESQISSFSEYGWSGESDKHEGKIAYSRDGVLCMNIRKRKEYYWDPVFTLSASNWRKHRDAIQENMERLLKNSTNNYEKKINEQSAVVDSTKTLFYKLYSNLSISDKKAFLQENKDSWLSKETCSVCLNKSIKKNKCLHHDCCGMCDDCAKNITDCDGKCKACNRTQLLTCPVCFENKKQDEMCKSFGCVHYVCWNCYGKAFHCGRPIISCPTCRGKFTEKNCEIYTDSEFDEHDDYLLDDAFDDDILDENEEAIDSMELTISELVQIASTEPAIHV